MVKYYWQGSKSFPEDAGELTFTSVKFDTETESLIITSTEVNEYIIEGLDEMWLVTEKFKCKTTPVPLVDISELLAITNSYKINDDKTLAKVRRFEKDRNTLVETEKLTRRTTY